MKRNGIQDEPDRAKVNVNNISDIENLQKKWKLFTQAQIIDAIKLHGPYQDNIEKFFQKHESE